METKVCIKCAELKIVTDYYYDIRYGNYINTCKLCKSKITSLWKTKNRAKVRYNQSVYRKNNPFAKKSKGNKHRQNINQNKSKMERLPDYYICQTLKIPKELITPELIEVKRLLIKTKRLCKTSQNSETV